MLGLAAPNQTGVCLNLAGGDETHEGSLPFRLHPGGRPGASSRPLSLQSREHALRVMGRHKNSHPGLVNVSKQVNDVL